MTAQSKTVLVWTGALVLLAVVGIYYSPPAQFVRAGMRQVRAGQRVMESIKDADIQKWIQRADALLPDTNMPSTSYTPPIGYTPIPDDLAALGIQRIDIQPPDCVAFVWLGGIDHTELVIMKEATGEHTVIARYNHKHEKQLWPKDTAKGMEDWRYQMNLPPRQSN